MSDPKMIQMKIERNWNGTILPGYVTTKHGWASCEAGIMGLLARWGKRAKPIDNGLEFKDGQGIRERITFTEKPE